MKVTLTSNALAAESALMRSLQVRNLSSLLRLSAQDQLQIGMTVDHLDLTSTVGANVEEPGVAYVQTARIFDVWSQLPKGQPVTIDIVDRHHLRVSCQHYTALLLGADAAFTTTDALEDTAVALPMPTEALRRLLSAAYAAGEWQTGLTKALHWDGDGDTMTAVATDGHRMARCQAALTPRGHWAWPVRAAQTALRMLDDTAVSTVTLGERAVRIACGHRQLTTRYADAKPIPWKTVWPAAATWQVSVEREALLTHLDRLLPLVSDDRMVKLEITPGQLILRTRDQASASRLDAITTARMTLGLNATYLRDALRQAAGDTAIIEGTDAIKPVVVHTPGILQLQHVIMPMRT